MTLRPLLGRAGQKMTAAVAVSCVRTFLSAAPPFLRGRGRMDD